MAAVVLWLLLPGITASYGEDQCEEQRWDLRAIPPGRLPSGIDPTLPEPEVVRVVESRIPARDTGCGGSDNCAGQPVLEIYVRNSLGHGTFSVPCETAGGFLLGLPVKDDLHVFTFDASLNEDNVGCYQGIRGSDGKQTPPTYFNWADIPFERR